MCINQISSAAQTNKQAATAPYAMETMKEIMAHCMDVIKSICDYASPDEWGCENCDMHDMCYEAWNGHRVMDICHEIRKDALEDDLKEAIDNVRDLVDDINDLESTLCDVYGDISSISERAERVKENLEELE